MEGRKGEGREEGGKGMGEGGKPITTVTEAKTRFENTEL